MGLVLVVGVVAGVLVLTRFGWRSWRRLFADPEEYMSETWMKDHLYRSGAKRDWSDL